MKKKLIFKRSMAIGFSLLLLTLFLFPFSASAVTPSKTEYTVLLDRAADVFIGNKQPLAAKKGQEFYLSYKVETVGASTTSKQHGVVGTADNTAVYPYENGGQLKFGTGNLLLKEGFTYFLKLTVGKDGMACVAARAKGKENEYFSFANSYGKGNADLQYFGLWFGDGQVTAKLSHILCYDRNGKDLGIAFLEGRGISFEERALVSDPGVSRHYTVTASDAVTVALSNAKATTSDTVYMEYTVKQNASRIYQTGVIHTDTPTAVYPFTGGGGKLLFETVEKPGGGYLLQEGASYLIRFIRGETDFDALVQKTFGGKTESHKFTLSAGDYLKKAGYFSLWFGEGPDYPVDFKLTDFKCYDKDGNDLGLQSNVSLQIETFGELSDYDGCQAVYYEEESGNTVALYRDKSVKVTENGKTTEGSYYIQAGKLYLAVNGKTAVYDYAYRYFKAGGGKRYRRLGTYTVTFVTGTGKAPEREVLSWENGYIAKEPEKPTKDGAEFEGWFLSDGSRFSFGEMTVKSVTLYAKWTEKTVYSPASAQKGIGKMISAYLLPFLSVGAGVLIVVAGVVIGRILYRRGKKT